jgi:hypothetical protein
MTMHKTTRALLEYLRHTTTAFPKETPQYHDWREAGYPDLDEPEPEPEPGTCWTCAHDFVCGPGQHDCKRMPWVVGDGGQWHRGAYSWIDCCEDHNGMPPRNYSGPPCPGWEPRR